MYIHRIQNYNEQIKNQNSKIESGDSSYSPILYLQ